MNLVILHGWGQDKTFWDGVFPNGESSFSVHLLDLPGFGTEPLISSAWGIPEYATWVAEWIEARHLTNVVLLGHSFGGRIAGQLASQQPSWLKALVLYGAPNIYRPSAEVVLKKRLAGMMGPLKNLIPSQLKKRWQAKDYLDVGSELRPVYQRIVQNDQISTLGRIKVPTLLLWGEIDGEVPLRIAKELERLIQGSQLIVLPHAGHSAHLESPYLFYGTIKKFIESLNV